MWRVAVDGPHLARELCKGRFVFGKNDLYFFLKSLSNDFQIIDDNRSDIGRREFWLGADGLK